MASVTSHQPGEFCWMELGTSDQESAKAFYGNLFGWTAADNPMGPGEVYTMFGLAGRAVGGAFRTGPVTQTVGIPPHWDLYVGVASADETTQKAVDAGGTLLKAPFDVFVYGRMAVIQDPTGAVICIWEAREQAGIEAKNEASAYCWADLSTPDPAAAQAFYQKVFGWSIEGGPADYLHIRNGETFVGGVQSLSQRNPNAPAHWLTYFQVLDCAASTAKAASSGAHILAPNIFMENVGTFTILADPQGAVFALHQPAHGS